MRQSQTYEQHSPVLGASLPMLRHVLEAAGADPPVPVHRHHQVSGHFACHLDPLGLDKRTPPAELDPAFYGFTEADMDKE